MKSIKLTVIIILFRFLNIMGQEIVLKVNTGHSGGVNSVAFSLDGKYIVSGSDDKTLKLWAVNTGKEIRTFKGHSDVVRDVAFSPNGKYIASGGGGTVKLWDVNSDKEIWTFKGGYYAFSPDGKNLILGSGDKLVQWDISTGEKMKEYNKPPYIATLTLSPDGKYIASGSRADIDLWDINSGKIIKTFHDTSYGMRVIAFSPDQKFMVSSSGYGAEISFWNIESGEKIKTFIGHSTQIITIAFSPDGKYIVSGTLNASVDLWDVSTGKVIRTFAGHSGYVNSVAFSPDGKFIVSGSSDNTIKLWDVNTTNKILTFGGIANNFSIHKNNSDYLLLDGSNLRYFDFDLGKISKTIDRPGSLVFQNYLVHHHFDTLSIYDVRNNSLFVKYRIYGLERWIMNSQSFSNDFKYFVQVRGDVLVLIETLTGNEKELVGHFYGISDFEFSPDGKYIVSSSGDKTIKLWDANTGKEIRTFKGHSNNVCCVAFSPDGKTIVSSSWDKTVKLWDINTGQKIKTFKGHSEWVTSVAFSNDGKYIVSGDGSYSGDITLKLWNINSGEEIRTFHGQGKSLYDAIFSPDGNNIIFSHAYDAISIFDVKSGQIIKTFPQKGSFFSKDYKYAFLNTADSLTIWDLKEKKVIKSIKNINITQLQETDNNKYFFLVSNGSFKLLNNKTFDEIITFYSIGKADWVLTTPDGRFDASASAVDKMYYVKGLNVIPLENLMEQFYTPNLWARVLSGERFVKTEVNINEIKLPPLVKFTSPNANIRSFKPINNILQSEQQTINITVQTIDMGGGIDEILLYQNGKLIETTNRGYKVVAASDNIKTKTFSVTLVDGINLFKATAFNNQRTEAIPDELKINYVGSQTSKPNLYLFVIGINEYKNSKYNLNYAVPDALGFKQQMEQGTNTIFGDIKTIYLTNAAATKIGILQEINNIKTIVKQQDVFIFYYAGHGVMSEEQVPIYYIIPHDVTQLYGNDQNLQSNAISANELKQFSTGIKAQKQMYILDACQSGGMVRMLASRGSAEEKALWQLAHSAGTYWLAASNSDQFAGEFAQLGHGLFTYCILQGLSGKADGQNDKKITVQEISAYVNDQVPILSKQYKGSEQYPNIYGYGNDFPIIILK